MTPNRQNESLSDNKKNASLKERLQAAVEKAEDRRLRGRKKGNRSLWFGFGYFGMVGWLVMTPTLLLLALGVWIDTRTGGTVSWTLTLFFTGLAIGLTNAWFWIKKQRKEIENERKS